jgi:hypothetical protein
MVPAVPAKMKFAELPFPPLLTLTGNAEVFVLATWPVGPWGPDAVAAVIAILPVGGLTAVTLVTFVWPVTDQRLVILCT